MLILTLMLVGLSIYYRIYLSNHKAVPFNPPTGLSLFFPKPVNYEHEITVLCSKYMNC